MTLTEFRSLLGACPLIASVQTNAGSPVDDPATIARLAKASLDLGVKVLRLQGLANIEAARQGVPVIGLIKRDYPGFEVFITATKVEVQSLIDAGCEVIALDGTARPRPNGEGLADLISQIHQAGRLAMADCDSLESAKYAAKAGADILGTTLAGFTSARPMLPGPDLELLRQVVGLGLPVVAEGRFENRAQTNAAMLIGAVGTVVGGALNDPVKQTRALWPTYAPTFPALGQSVGAIDIGGTWLRFAVLDGSGAIVSERRERNPHPREDRLAWIKARTAESGITRLGVSTGGVIDPATGEVWTAKEYLMPNQIGIKFSRETLGVEVIAWGDGHAHAWAHACLPAYAGRRLAAIALGTGVGFGFVESGRIWCGRRGEYPRLNDLPAGSGRSYEDLLGGIHLTKDPTSEQKADAVEALRGAVAAVRGLYFPDDIIIAGGVGLAPWLADEVEELGLVPTPFGHDAGLVGAWRLAVCPPPLPEPPLSKPPLSEPPLSEPQLG